MIFYTFSKGLWDFQKVQVTAIHSKALNLGNKDDFLTLRFIRHWDVASKSCEASTDT